MSHLWEAIVTCADLHEKTLYALLVSSSAYDLDIVVHDNTQEVRLQPYKDDLEEGWTKLGLLCK